MWLIFTLLLHRSSNLLLPLLFLLYSSPIVVSGHGSNNAPTSFDVHRDRGNYNEFYDDYYNDCDGNYRRSAASLQKRKRYS